jgi:hypothetical protein
MSGVQKSDSWQREASWGAEVVKAGTGTVERLRGRAL